MFLRWHWYRVPSLLLLAFLFGDWPTVGGSNLPTLSLTDMLARHFNRAIEKAKREQEVEDHNALAKLDNSLDRRYIVMPMTDAFDPPPGHFSRGHLQMGDKISMPKSIWTYIRRQNLEMPWQFEIEVIGRDEEHEDSFEEADEVALELESDQSELDEEEEEDNSEPEEEIPEENQSDSKKKKKQLRRVYASILDFRSPENFIFIPDWMMKSLRLCPWDVVRMRYLLLPQGGLVKFQPHSSDFLKLSNHQAVLENELKHYSCLTAGTTISFKYRNKVYDMDVVELLSGGKSVEMVCVQDCDIATDFLPALDSLKKRRSTPK